MRWSPPTAMAMAMGIRQRRMGRASSSSVMAPLLTSFSIAERTCTAGSSTVPMALFVEICRTYSPAGNVERERGVCAF